MTKNRFQKSNTFRLSFLLFGIIIFLQSPSFSQCGPPPSANCSPVPASELLNHSSSNVDFTFDTFSKINNGITISGSTILRLRVVEPVAGLCKWALRVYIDNNGGATPINEWETVNTYGAGSGATPTLDLMDFKVYNGCGTPIFSGVYQNFAAATGSFIDIINDVGAINPAGSCILNVNGAGSYLTNYNEYTFTIDYRIQPGFTYTPGMYQTILKFCLVEAL